MRSIVGPETVALNEGNHPCPRLRIPQDLPPSISRHVVPVTKHEDVFKDFQARRDRNYRLLIHRFIYQILYGCINPFCTTPTCLSYRKRTTKAPLRRFTRLSARTLACHLASEPNVESALCPYCPQVCPDSEPVSAVKRRPRRKSHNVTFEAEGKPRSNSAAQKSAENEHLMGASNQRSKPGVLRSSSQDPPRIDDIYGQISGEGIQSAWEKLGAQTVPANGPVRDSKSFTQSLFETMPLRMLEWLPFTTLQVDDHPPYPSSLGTSGGTSGDEGSHGKKSDQHPASPNDRINQKVLSAILQRPSTQPPPSPIPKRMTVSMQKSLNGDAHSVSRSGEEQLHMVAASPAEHERERRTSLDDAPPVSLSIPPNSASPWSVEPSPSLSIKSTHDSTKNSTSDSSTQEHVCDTNRQRSFAEEGHRYRVEQDPSDRAFAKSKRSNTVFIYSLGRISGKTFRELRLTQAKMEDQCLGYRLIGHPSWMEAPKPRADLALVFSGWTDFVQQSLFYLLKDCSRLAHAFEWSLDAHKMCDPAMWPTSIHPTQGRKIFRALYSLRPSHEILQFLSYSLDQASVGTFELLRPFRGQLQPDDRTKASPSGEQSVNRSPTALSNKQAAFAFGVILYGLSGLTAIEHRCSTPDHLHSCWNTFCGFRSQGRISPVDLATPTEQTPACQVDLLKLLTDIFEDESALDVVSKLAQTASNRVVFSEATKMRDTQGPSRSQTRRSVLHLLMQYLKDFAKCERLPRKFSRPLPLSFTTLEWLRTVVLRDWDGKPIIRRAGSVGGSLQLLAAMYEERSELKLAAEAFHTPFFVERMDAMEMPVEWLSYRPDNKAVHLLSYSFLFPPSALVTYFRALNFATMSKSFEKAVVTTRHVYQFAYSDSIRIADRVRLRDAMELTMANYLVLNVRRDRVLTDAVDQLWRRRKSELMAPLKVRMGMDEGEEGVDHGGVQQEFFRCLLVEALEPDYGMFTVDKETHMTWFRPGSLEPLYKFEVLGTLFSIAVYNSITLPVTFPLALYRKLLGLPVKRLSHIRDGWPVLARGLQELLTWSEGDVADIFMRTYEFSYDAFGQRIDVDINRVSRDDTSPSPDKRSEAGCGPHGSSRKADPESLGDPSNHAERSTGHRHSDSAAIPSSSPPLVTNSTRSQYVRDYIHHLTKASISPQFDAFEKGFLTCLSQTPSAATNPTSSHAAPSTLSIFHNTPQILQSVIEGQHQPISTADLERVTRYEDGYHPNHPTIRLFWDVIHRDFDEEQRRGLLEFVTASERVPVGGLERVEFVVQRCGTGDPDGRGGERLPTSMTCFGRLLLPEYEQRQVLKEKLEKAIENCRGFGVA